MYLGLTPANFLGVPKLTHAHYVPHRRQSPASPFKLREEILFNRDVSGTLHQCHPYLEWDPGREAVD